MSKKCAFVLLAACLFFVMATSVPGQQTVGAITGTVMDSSGAAVPDATVKAVNVATNLEVRAKTKSNGSYLIPDLPAGTYKLTVTKEGFKTETHTEVLVNADRTTTIDASLVVGTVSMTVEVNSVALMNQVDTTVGYVVETQTIQDTPLGTGSFTQLAILSPGVHSDFIGGAGTNAGLGNQAIFANGNRDTSNSFSLNGISTNNLFNGNSTSQVGENRFVLNTGENFGAAGGIQTSTSVYGAIGQALPTPPPDAIQEIAVNSSQYDATQGNNSGAHIGVLTKSGTNTIHGSAWEQWQNSDMNAAPFFYNAAGVNPNTSQLYLPRPFLNRNSFGTTVGGPIKKDKLFYFASYQGVRVADAGPSTKQITVPLGLTDDRSQQGIINMIQSSFGKTITAGQINPAAYDLLNAKLPNGQYLIPSSQYNVSDSTQVAQAVALGYDATLQGPNTHASVNQAIGAIDYVLGPKDRLSAKYYFQNDPTNDPFGAVGDLLGFPQQLSAGSQVFSITNNVVLSPNLTWEQHFGFTRLRAYAATTQGFSASALGMTLPGGNTFPQFDISTSDPHVSRGIEFGPSTSFGDGGMFQNQWEYGTSMSWVKGKHTISIGTAWDHTQLNVVNNNLNTDTVNFKSFLTFVEGTLKGGDAFVGSASRYYRSDTIGTYVNDNFKVRSNLTITAGLRWDVDGPLSEKNGKLVGFDPSKYSYVQCTVAGAAADPTANTCDPGTDTITSAGLEIARPGDSLMKNHQWGFAPRIGIAWTPMPRLTVRAGYGLYYDRGELFSYLSPSAGAGFNGPFGVTLAPPFVQPVSVAKGATLSQPFPSTLPSPPPATDAALQAYLPNLNQTACGYPGCWPTGNLFGPLLFGGYDLSNKLPYTENWTVDLQYQATNNWLFEVGYVGNHGNHLILPIPFNQPQIATAANPVNHQIYSYGGTPCYGGESGLPAPCQYPDCCSLETVSTNEYSGNAPVRVPYPGLDMNSVLYEAQGVSNYNALQAQVRKRLSMGLTLTGSYTWSHALDEQSGLGLFFTGNNPLTPRANYASSDFDQTHVFLINYSYTIPKFVKNESVGKWVNGWIIGGQTVAQSGQPYSVYDYTGSVGSLFFGTDDEIGNPIVPLKAGVTPAQAKLQGTTGVNAGNPVLNPSAFAPQFVAPGTNGVPACDASGCDIFESLYGNSGRNLFRGPFQVRFDMSLAKQFPIYKDRFQLRFEADAFNIFNHPDFDAPNNDVSFFGGNYTGPAFNPPQGSLGMIQHTIGSPRFLQLGLHLYF